MTADPLAAWLAETLGQPPQDIALFRRALTHSSHNGESYERLEFLGDRVLNLSAAALLYRRFPDEPEGNLSRRLAALVSRETCAEVGRDLGVHRHLRLGKQARDDGADKSDNVVGDVVEALIGALFLEAGLPAAEAFVARAWGPQLEQQPRAPRHPKSALQEWAAANRCKPPHYELVAREGPQHAPRFVVAVSIPNRPSVRAEAEGASKQEAETAAAKALFARLS